MSRVEEIRESDIGTGAGLFNVEKIGDEYFTFIVDCDEPKACSIILRGASRDVLNEVERKWARQAHHQKQIILLQLPVAFWLESRWPCC